jgi:hypothetical protein
MEAGWTTLGAALAGTAFEPHTLNAAQGALLLTVRGARVLGIFLDGEDENLLWTAAALRTHAGAQAFLASGDWNMGGDRCWLAPELELHFKDRGQPSHLNYLVPPAVDPGFYALEHSAETGLAFRGGGDVQNIVSGRPFRFETTRAVTLVAPPLATDGVSYVGYLLTSELHIARVDRPAANYGLWQLVQVPAGGTVYIPVRRQPEMVDFFGTNVAAHCHLLSTHVEFPITAQQMQKLGLRPHDVAGVMGYYRPRPGGRATLLVRRAAIFPGAVYADYPFAQPQRRDIAFQFYNDQDRGPADVGVGEMEYHSSAAHAGNFFSVKDVSCLWAFAGPAERIRAIAGELLGVEIGA